VGVGGSLCLVAECLMVIWAGRFGGRLWTSVVGDSEVFVRWQVWVGFWRLLSFKS